VIRNAETNGKLSEDRAVPALTRTQNKQHSEEMITPFHSVAICTGTRYHYSVLFFIPATHVLCAIQNVGQWNKETAAASERGG